MTTERTHRETNNADHEAVKCEVGSGIDYAIPSARDRNREDVSGEELHSTTIYDEVDAHFARNAPTEFHELWTLLYKQAYSSYVDELQLFGLLYSQLTILNVTHFSFQACTAWRNVKGRFVEQSVEAGRFQYPFAKGRTARPREQCSYTDDAHSEAIIQLLSLDRKLAPATCRSSSFR